MGSAFPFRIPPVISNSFILVLLSNMEHNFEVLDAERDGAYIIENLSPLIGLLTLDSV